MKTVNAKNAIFAVTLIFLGIWPLTSTAEGQKRESLYCTANIHLNPFEGMGAYFVVNNQNANGGGVLFYSDRNREMANVSVGVITGSLGFPAPQGQQDIVFDVSRCRDDATPARLIMDRKATEKVKFCHVRVQSVRADIAPVSLRENEPTVSHSEWYTHGRQRCSLIQMVGDAPLPSLNEVFRSSWISPPHVSNMSFREGSN